MIGGIKVQNQDAAGEGKKIVPGEETAQRPIVNGKLNGRF